MQDEVFLKFIEKLKQEKSNQEVGLFLENLFKFAAAELYFVIVSQLTEEDFAAIDKIQDEEEAEQEIINRFKEKSGMTPEEFVLKLRNEIARGNLI